MSDDTSLEEHNDGQINNDFIYTVSSLPFNNPFFITATLIGRKHRALIDTGADLSIVHQSMIPSTVTTTNFIGNECSACENRLNIQGHLTNVKLTINKKA
ncbi:hypothetical protein NGRA_2521 [Nosema granulosis]|uniref:Peptidase A2 domain-containing protein n=1 Tax=Nosema granulosis TaxID=83296 RepID=A0A9P6GWH3_9MICR|nr:hypothetical protein NGRA_2521 [Nosema granulosis]